MSQVDYDKLDDVPSQSDGISEILADDWNLYVRDNFSSLKSGHLVVVNEAGRPSGVVDGTMVFVQSLKELQVWDNAAASWVRVASVGFANGLADGVVVSSVLGALSVTSAKIADNAVTNAKLRDSAGLSVIGRGANSSGDPADIVGSDGQVLRVSGTSLGFGTITSAGIEDGTIALADLSTVLQNALNPVGSVQAYAGSAAPPGWLLCDGQVVSQSTYAALFGVVSTTYNTGGEGSGNFRLPDLRGRVITGVGVHSDVNAPGDRDSIDAAYRRPVHKHSASTSVDAHDLNHSHGVTDGGHSHGLNMRTAQRGAGSNSVLFDSTNTSTGGPFNIGPAAPGAVGVQPATTGVSVNQTTTLNNVTHSASTTVNTSADANTPSDVVPYLVLNYIIKV